MDIFQWVNGPNIGKTVVLDYIDIENGQLYLNFRDGSRCNRDLLLLLNEFDVNGKALSHISGEDNKWNISIEHIPAIEEKYAESKSGEKFCVQPYSPPRVKIKRYPPKFYHCDEIKTFDTPTSPTQKKPSPKPIEQAVLPKQKIAQQPEPIINKQTPNDTVQSDYLDDTILIESLCKKCNKVDVNIGLDVTLELPSFDVYKIINTNFENGEKGFREYLNKHITSEDVKARIIDAVCKSYAANLS
ncbi:MAG: hypothetical protein ACRDD8_14205 [Bacteroidales bacterium]